MQKVQAILFDLDNTLSDFMQMKEEACKAAVSAMVNAGLEMAENDAYNVLMAKYFELGLESDVAFSAFLKQINQFDHRILAAAINAYLERKASFVMPYPKVEQVLRLLRERGVVLAIVTDAPKTKAYQRLLTMGIDKYFVFLVGFEDTQSKKQTGLPLALALQKLKRLVLGLLNSEVLMVGDSVTRDLLPAKSLGLQTALCVYGQREDCKEVQGACDFELTSFEDLLKIV